MILGPNPICLKCARFHENNKDGFTCDAFPDGIPEEIVLSGVNHNRPFPGDNGLQFVPRVKFSVIGADGQDLSPFAVEVLGRTTMGSADPSFASRMHTQIAEVDRLVSELSPENQKKVWKALYTVIDELRSPRRK